MELIDRILSEENIKAAIHAVKSNKGAPGIDKMAVEALDEYFAKHGKEIKEQIRAKQYKPQPVRRVYIPKANGKQRPLGIPTVVDRVIQQAVAQILSRGYERYFSDHSHGFRPGRSCHTAMEQALEYLNAGYEWAIDLDIEKYFDTVKPLSPVLSNVYLDKLDKELEGRGLCFVRYADDCNIFVRSEMAANRVMASVSSWLERKLRLKVNATKTKVVRPTGSSFLGFTFWKSSEGWKPRPLAERKACLCGKVKEILCRKRAAALPLGYTFTRLNQVLRGWINYFRIGSMKGWLKNDFSPWLRHKVRVVILKQWKKPKTIYKNLMKLNKAFGCNMTHEDIFKVANSRLGLYRRSGMDVVNYLLSQKVLAIPNKKENRPGLVDPLAYYLRNT